MRPFLALIVLSVATPAIAAPGVRVYQSASDSSITEGETVIDGDPADVFAVVLDYPKWTEIFPDVAKVVVTSQKEDDARITLIAPDGHRDNLHFRNQPKARMVFFEDTGGSRVDVWAEIVFVAGDQPHTTRVHTRLYANVHGLASLVVADGDVRKVREQKIERDLVHIRGYFRRR